MPWAGRRVGLPADPAVRAAVVALLFVFVLLFAFVGYEAWITGIFQSRSQSALLAEFKSDLALDDTKDVLTPPAGRPVGLLSIPSIGVQQMIVQGITADETKKGPGHDPTTPAPGQAGNSVVIGRHSTYGRPFRDLGQLNPGDKITVLTRQGQFTYTVGLVRNADLGSRVVTAPTGEDRLTLVTGSSAIPLSETVVVAQLEGDGLQAPGPLQVPADGFHPGKSTGTSPWGAIILWGELFALAIFVTWRLSRRRWNTPITYLLTTPLLLPLAFLFFR